MHFFDAAGKRQGFHLHLGQPPHLLHQFLLLFGGGEGFPVPHHMNPAVEFLRPPLQFFADLAAGVADVALNPIPGGQGVLGAPFLQGLFQILQQCECGLLQLLLIFPVAREFTA